MAAGCSEQTEAAATGQPLRFARRSAARMVGGCAGDDEVLAALTGALPTGTAVGRGVVAGTLGHRYAVAHGLLQWVASTSHES